MRLWWNLWPLTAVLNHNMGKRGSLAVLLVNDREGSKSDRSACSWHWGKGEENLYCHPQHKQAFFHCFWWIRLLRPHNIIVNRLPHFPNIWYVCRRKSLGLILGPFPLPYSIKDISLWVPETSSVTSLMTSSLKCEKSNRISSSKPRTEFSRIIIFYCK